MAGPPAANLRLLTWQKQWDYGPRPALSSYTRCDAIHPELHLPRDLRSDGYWLKTAKIRGSECLLITASTDRGVLYGVFALLSKIARAESLAAIDEEQQPYAPIRWVNQW